MDSADKVTVSAPRLTTHGTKDETRPDPGDDRVPETTKSLSNPASGSSTPPHHGQATKSVGEPELPRWTTVRNFIEHEGIDWGIDMTRSALKKKA